MERVAGADPYVFSNEYGKQLRLTGDVDKMRVAQGRKEIDNHVAELCPLIEQGGFIPTINHAVSPDISLDSFVYCI